MDKLKLLKGCFIAAIVFAIISAYLSFILGQDVDRLFFSGFIVTLLLILSAVNIYGKMRYHKGLMALRNEWGKPRERKRKFEEIKELFSFIEKPDRKNFYIDDQTFEDLNMKDIYALLDRTVSTPGEQGLYNLIKTPLMDKEEIIKRSNIIRLFQENSELREKLQMILYGLGRQKGSYITSFLWRDTPSAIRGKFAYIVLSNLGIASLLLTSFLGMKAFYIVFGIFGINQIIHMKIKQKIEGYLDTIKYIYNLIGAAIDIGNSTAEGLKEYFEGLNKASTSCKAILEKAKFLNLEKSFGDLYQYANILFFIELRSYNASIKEILAHREELKELYLKVGEIDALISIASYREGIEKYVEPDIRRDGRRIDAVNLRHPLIKNPVGNSVGIDDRGIVITGSNMSGKSTFLRTLGINALFAQTICTCLADSYKGSFFKMMTSISQGDNLVGGKSYYLAEAEALLRIIKSSGDKVPTLCIVDEIFRGTNPIERTGASAEILRYLMNNNCIVIVATHDIEIAEMVRGLYDFYYFSEDISEKGLNFDYLLKQGISKNRNAVKLMKYLGYPGEIIERTTERVQNMV